ncbi:TonB-dependent receptor plug domain-containing protein [Gaopeijia maritima]|uniref:TonB-dependent receptor n=1 Tax=Gaopeijia maritima TaxID=3119007 RepID=A0ABU9EEQ8_9BACT
MIRAAIVRAGVLVALVATGASAQSGRVIDPTSGRGVAGASLAWLSGGDDAVRARITAGSDGGFQLPENWTSTGRLRVTALGRATLVLDWTQAAAAEWTLALPLDPLELGAVVVTAAGRAQERVEVAVPMERVTAEDMRVTAAPSVERLLSEIPGLQVTASAPNGSNLMIRGIGDSRVLVLVDGQPMGGSLIEDRDLSRMSLAGLERVEVVKGPLSSLYGSDALGGVINLVTRDPDAGFSLDARALSGGFGRHEAELTAAGGGDLRYRLTGAWRQQDEAPGIDATTGVFARVWDLRSTLRWAPESASRLRVRADATLLRERQRWPVGGGFSGFNDNEGLTGWVEATRALGPGEVTTRIFAQRYGHLYRQARGDAPIAGGEEDEQRETVVRGTLGWATRLGAHRIDLGVEAARRAIASPGKLSGDEAVDRQLDLFAQDAWDFGRGTLSAGARLTSNDRWGSTVSPSLGVSALASDVVRLRASAGRGFRAPSFKELEWNYANLGAGYVLQGFGDLEPERSWNVGAGIDVTPTAAFAFTVDAFHNRIDGMIQFAFTGNTPAGLLIYSPRNLDRAVTRGLELEASWRRDAWWLSGDYALLDTEDEATGLPLDRRARHSGRVRTGAVVEAAGTLRLDATVHVTGSAPVIGTDDQGQPAEIDTQQGLTSLDLQARWEPWSGVALMAGVANLLDDRPDGWPGINGRRLRIGIEASDLF